MIKTGSRRLIEMHGFSNIHGYIPWLFFLPAFDTLYRHHTMEDKKQMHTIPVEFVRGIIGTDDIMKKRMPQIAFLGRSNVGKSSVINALLGRKNLVKSSATPGKTQEINFFLIEKKYYFVDLPGYGFARLPNKTREKLRKRIVWYLSEAERKPDFVFIILDAVVGETDHDRELLELLKTERIPFAIIVNKIDKLKKSSQKEHVQKICAGIEGTPCFPFSAKTKEGREAVWEEIQRHIAV
ncbi:ribosome biogenesis GTP-binding protein YihA/YsxC [bacterium]|nr:ribosome biogenesis GTP-binding protein YihA/YsxC [bacterium]